MDNTKEEIKAHNELIELQPRNLNYILTTKAKPRKLLLDPWLARPSLAMIYAGTGVGKTFFCLNAAYAIGSGGDFLKFAAPQAAKILYLDGEMSYDAIQPRIELVASTHEKMLDQNNFLLFTCDQFPNSMMPKVSTLEGQNFYNRIIFDNKVEVVFIDNISTLTDLDENKADEWGVVQEWLIFLRAHGISVVLIHHAGKDKKTQRGTSKREDILDTVILLQEVNLFDQEIGVKFHITFKKKRNFFGAEAEPFEAYLNKSGEWHMKSNEESTMDKVIELSKLGMNQVQIAYEIGIKQSSVSRAYHQAVQEGIIKPKVEAEKPKKLLKGRHWENPKD